jgi:multisubunit Na+/H+ antiporter MnhE subunit
MPAYLPAVGRWLARWALLMALWLLLTDTHQWQELVAGAVTAAIGATVAGLVVRPGQPKTVSKSLAVLSLGPRRLGRPLVRLVADTGILTLALVRALAGRRPRGSFRVVRFTPDPPRRSAAGRAMTEIWGSLTPNRYVVGIDDEDGVLMIHELVRTDEPLDPLAER